MNDKIVVTKSSLPPFDEYVYEIKDIWESHWLTNMGSKHNELEAALKKYLEVSNISLFANGHMALELCIQAMNLSGKVITTPFTFASTTHAIVRNGLKPIFCDIDPITYTIDTNKIEDLITEQVSAIIPVHVYGNVCNVEEIERISKKYNLKIIYDAAHAFGVKYKDKGIGMYGDASMLSFHATKVYNTIEGGAICYKNQELGLDLYRLKNFGIRNPECVDYVGANAKMNEFQAAMGICNLRYIDNEIQKRKAVSECYMECLEGTEGIIMPALQENVTKNYSYFPILVDELVFGINRDTIFNKLAQNNIFTRKYFYPLTSSYDCYQSVYDVNQTPVALYISEHILTLPIYADLELSNVEKICSIIKSMKR